jgi:hypothetical protein
MPRPLSRNSGREPSPDSQVSNRQPTPFSDSGFDPFARKLSKGEVDECLKRLYARPVDEIRKANAERDEDLRVVLEHAISPAKFAIERGKELAKEYQRQRRQTPVPRMKRPATVPLATRSPHRTHSSDREESEVQLADDEIELKTASEFVQRFYKERLNHHEKILAKARAKYLAPMPNVQVDPETCEAAIDRLYTKRPRKEHISAAAARKLYGPPLPAVKKSPEEIKKSVERLFKETVQAKEEKLAAIDKEFLERQKKSNRAKKVDKTDLELIVKRLNRGAKS